MNYGLRRLLHAAVKRWWLIAFAIATLWVWQRYAVVQAGHRIAERRTHVEELSELRDALLAENTTLSSRQRIEAIAMTRLSLQPTREDQYAVITQAPLSEIGTGAAAQNEGLLDLSGTEDMETGHEPETAGQ